MTVTSTTGFDPCTIATVLRHNHDVRDHSCAEHAAVEIADAWNEGDFDLTTTRDILGDYVDGDFDRNDMADRLAADFGVELV